MKMVILAAGNGVCIEIFQFMDPPYNGPNKRIDWNTNTYTRGRVYHVCLTVANPDSKADEAIKLGGKQFGARQTPASGE